VHRFEKAANITDPVNAPIREKVAQAKQADPRPESLPKVLARKAQTLGSRDNRYDVAD
jgi:hypothetical protein